jgi:hypothetical protein
MGIKKKFILIIKLVETSYNTMFNKWANVISTKGGSNDCNID